MEDKVVDPESIEISELCQMQYMGLIEKYPAPLPGMYERGWVKKSGQLILTQDKLLFLERSGCLAPSKPKLIFSAPRSAVSSTVRRFALTTDQLEVIFGSEVVQFSVSDPDKWKSALDKPN